MALTEYEQYRLNELKEVVEEGMPILFFPLFAFLAIMPTFGILYVCGFSSALWDTIIFWILVSALGFALDYFTDLYKCVRNYGAPRSRLRKEYRELKAKSMRPEPNE